MKVFIKNKIISLGGNSQVFNEQQEPIYNVKGTVMSPTKKKLMCDMDGKLLYTIRNRWFNFFTNKTFVFDAENNKVATIVKSKWSFNHRYKITDSLDELQIEGKFFSLTSKILKNGQEAGVINRDITLIGDSFSLEANPEDIPFFTALVIALDNIIDKRQNDRD